MYSTSGSFFSVHGEQLAGVLVLALQPLVAFELALDAGVLGRDARRALLVVPEAGLGQLALELGKPLL